MLALAAGGTVDFAVGFGADGEYFSDSTGLTATVVQGEATIIPLPASGALGALGLILAATPYVWRRLHPDQVACAVPAKETHRTT